MSDINTEYNNYDELCKSLKELPIELVKIKCKDYNLKGDINKTFLVKGISFLILLIVLLSLILYFLFIRETTRILNSNIRVGILITTCIIFSVYYSIMSYLEEGQQGLIGEKGATGEQGPPGIKGKMGLKGYRGDIGITGDPGDIGLLGPDGPPGPKGDTGVRGVRGNRGKTGIKGYKGIQGENGKNGKPGVNGEIGPPGENGDDNSILFGAAEGGSNMFGDTNKSHPVFTYDSEYQDTIWKEYFKYYDVKNDKSNREKCDTSKSTLYNNKSFNECKELCTDELTEDGYMRCVGIYGDLDPTNPDSIFSSGSCYICPERIQTLAYIEDNYKLRNSANKRATDIWPNFVTGLHLKTIKNDTEENDSAHAYLSRFYISNKE
jgi:hypothetical protein